MRKITKVKLNDINFKNFDHNHLKIELVFNNNIIKNAYIYSLKENLYKNLLTIENYEEECHKFIKNIFDEIYLLYSNLENKYIDFKVKILNISNIVSNICSLNIVEGYFNIEINKINKNFVIIYSYNFFINNKIYKQCGIIEDLTDLEELFTLENLTESKELL